MALTWLSVDRRTGVILAELGELDVPTVGRRIGTYTTATATLPLAGAPSGWQRATLHGGAAMVLVDEATAGGPTVLWGGDVVFRDRGANADLLMTLATPEAFLMRRFIVDDLTYTGTGQCAIVADLMDRYVQDATYPIRVEIVGADTHTMNRTYTASEHKSVFAVLQLLAGVIDGPQFTIGWEWGSNTGGELTVTPVMYVGNRLGVPTAQGASPAAVFETPGNLTDFHLVESYAENKGANSVTAYSMGAGGVTPQSTTVTTVDLIRPKTECHFSPSSSITETTTLDAHAGRASAALANGARTISLTAAINRVEPFSIGDDVGYNIPPGVDPSFPDGLVGVSQCLGWDISTHEPVTITPILTAEEWNE